ncbi:hypothetical protein [Variovorax sp. VaC1]|uniref:hypothetical protein n=1 Tax=Variovorax sp. VaC1 TaxID=3373132 RepID=UPI003749986F
MRYELGQEARVDYFYQQIDMAQFRLQPNSQLQAFQASAFDLGFLICENNANHLVVVAVQLNYAGLERAQEGREKTRQQLRGRRWDLPPLLPRRTNQ